MAPRAVSRAQVMRMFPEHPGPLSNDPEITYLCCGDPFRPLHAAGAVYGRCMVVSCGGALVSGPMRTPDTVTLAPCVIGLGTLVRNPDGVRVPRVCPGHGIRVEAL